MRLPFSPLSPLPFIYPYSHNQVISPTLPHASHPTNISPLVFGYNNGVIGGVLVLPSFTHAFSLPPTGTPAYNSIIENIVSLFQIGGLIGAMATFPGMKFWGRRVALAISAGVYTVGAAVQVCDPLPSSFLSCVSSGLGGREEREKGEGRVEKGEG